MIKPEAHKKYIGHETSTRLWKFLKYKLLQKPKEINNFTQWEKSSDLVTKIEKDINQWWQTFSEKGHVGNTLDLRLGGLCHTTRLCCCNVKADKNNTKIEWARLCSFFFFFQTVF